MKSPILISVFMLAFIFFGMPKFHALAETFTDIRLRVFIPARAVLVPIPGAADSGYSGDNRSFSYDAGTSRAELWVDISNDINSGNLLTIKRRDFDRSEKYRAEDLESVGGKPVWWKTVKKIPFIQIELPPIDSGIAEVTNDSLAVTARVEPQPFNLVRTIRLTFHVNGILPLDPLAPAVDCDLDVLLTPSPVGVSFSVKGAHDGFPAYELYIQRKLVYFYDPVQANASPTDLLPPLEILVDVPLTILPLF